MPTDINMADIDPADMADKRFFSFSLKTQAMKGVRFETVNGVEYMVAPAVAAMEIVLNGFLLPAKEIMRFPEAWDGVPVPVGHPFDEYGWPVSASSLDQLFNTAGWFFNVEIDTEDSHKIRGEIWIDILRAQTLGGDVERAFSQIRAGYESEVSSAFYADIEGTPGTFNGEEYFGIFRNIIPDHLAVLLDEQGACNREDGCGFPQSNSDDQGSPAALFTHKENNMDRETIITALIACDCCVLDRDALEALSDDALVAMASMRDNFSTIRGDLNAQIQANDDAGDTGDAGDNDTGDGDAGDEEDGDGDTDEGVSEDALATFTSVVDEFGGLEAFVSAIRGANVATKERDALIAKIVANSSLTPDMLDALSDDALVALDADLLIPNYGGRAIRNQQKSGKVTKVKMPSLDDDK